MYKEEAILYRGSCAIIPARQAAREWPPATKAGVNHDGSSGATCKRLSVSARPLARPAAVSLGRNVGVRSGRAQHEIDMDLVVGKLDAAVLGAVEHACLEQRRD